MRYHSRLFSEMDEWRKNEMSKFTNLKEGQEITMKTNRDGKVSASGVSSPSFESYAAGILIAKNNKESSVLCAASFLEGFYCSISEEKERKSLIQRFCYQTLALLELMK